MKHKNATRILLLCYAGLLVCWLLAGVALFVYDRSAPTTVLTPQQAQLVQLAWQEDGTLLTTGGDPQLIFENVQVPVRAVQLQAEFANAPGEMDAYYTRKAGQGFSPTKRSYGYLQQDNTYWYSLPPGNVESLRVDLGTAAGNQITLTAVVLNPQQPFLAYILPSFGNLVAFVVIGALAGGFIYTIMELIQYTKTHRKSEA